MGTNIFKKSLKICIFCVFLVALVLAFCLHNSQSNSPHPSTNGVRALRDVIAGKDGLRVTEVEFWLQKRWLRVVSHKACNEFNDALTVNTQDSCRTGILYCVRIHMSDGSVWAIRCFVVEEGILINIAPRAWTDDFLYPTNVVLLGNDEASEWRVAIEYLLNGQWANTQMTLLDGGETDVSAYSSR